jgi:hypothetical protein
MIAQRNQRARFILSTHWIGQCPHENLCLAFYMISFNVLLCPPRMREYSLHCPLGIHPSCWTDMGRNHLVSTDRSSLKKLPGTTSSLHIWNAKPQRSTPLWPTSIIDYQFLLLIFVSYLCLMDYALLFGSMNTFPPSLILWVPPIS